MKEQLNAISSGIKLRAWEGRWKIWGKKEKKNDVNLSQYIRACDSESCNTHPVATSHILMVLSLEADTMWSPFGMMATDDTL